MVRMELPVLDKVCFMLSLRTGCVIMGIINLMMTVGVTAMLLVIALNISDALDSKREDIDTGTLSVVYTIVIMLVVLQLIKLIFDVIFVFAVFKRQSRVIKAYCIFWTVFLVLAVIGSLKSVFQMGASQVIAQIIYLCESFYFVVVVRSYLISINEDSVL